MLVRLLYASRAIDTRPEAIESIQTLTPGILLN